MFIARDGMVAPCINTAYGGPSRFFQQSIMLSHLTFGRLPEQDLMAIWQSEPCVTFREKFARREQAYNRVLGNSQFEASFIKLEEAFQEAKDAMPPAAANCREVRIGSRTRMVSAENPSPVLKPFSRNRMKKGSENI